MHEKYVLIWLEYDWFEYLIQLHHQIENKLVLQFGFEYLYLLEDEHIFLCIDANQDIWLKAVFATTIFLIREPQ
jgi:ABC-type polysaccharide transport system permease subunit